MPAKQIEFDHEARLALLRGVDQLSNAVRVTLGPRGRLVVLQKSFGAPSLVDDGVAIAKEIQLEDPFENIGAQLVREVANRTNDQAGDGTTTATLLAQAILREGLKLIDAGASAPELKRGLDAAVDKAAAELRKRSRSLKGREDVLRVATIAANDPAVGEIVADVLEAVGQEGVTSVEEGKGRETTFEIVEGMRFDKGYISPYFITDRAHLKCVLESPLILLYEKKVSSARDLVPIMEQVVKAGRHFLVIAEDVEGEALALLVLNRLRGGVTCAAVKAPGFGERRKAMLEDMAVLTGGQLISEELGIQIENVELKSLGSARRVEITKDDTTIVEGKGKKADVNARLHQLERLIETTTSKYDREKLEERLAKLKGGVAVIEAGAPTETEMKERKLRIDDALGATRAAMEEGLVAGGGSALAQIAPAIDKLELTGDARLGAGVVRKALLAPLHQIAQNSGVSGDIVCEKVVGSPRGTGLDAETCEYVDMMAAGIVDPLKVVRLALQNAASIAGMMLTTEALVAEPPEKEEETPSTRPPY
jgi:chaperonin GroEL